MTNENKNLNKENVEENKFRIVEIPNDSFFLNDNLDDKNAQESFDVSLNLEKNVNDEKSEEKLNVNNNSNFLNNIKNAFGENKKNIKEDVLENKIDNNIENINNTNVIKENNIVSDNNEANQRDSINNGNELRNIEKNDSAIKEKEPKIDLLNTSEKIVENNNVTLNKDRKDNQNIKNIEKKGFFASIFGSFNKNQSELQEDNKKDSETLQSIGVAKKEEELVLKVNDKENFKNSVNMNNVGKDDIPIYVTEENKNVNKIEKKENVISTIYKDGVNNVEKENKDNKNVHKVEKNSNLKIKKDDLNDTKKEYLDSNLNGKEINNENALLVDKNLQVKNQYIDVGNTIDSKNFVENEKIDKDLKHGDKVDKEINKGQLNNATNKIKNILITVLSLLILAAIAGAYYVYRNFDISRKVDKVELPLVEKNSYKGQDFVTKVYPMMSDVVIVGDSYSFYLGEDCGNDLLIYANEGLTIKDLNNAFEMAAKQERNYAFVFIGPNDFREEDKRKQTKIEDFKLYLKEKINLLKNSGKTVLVSTYLKSEFTDFGEMTFKIKIKDYDKAVQEVCEENEVTYVDLSNINDYHKNKRTKYDGQEDILHFNKEFNIKLVNVLYSYIYDLELEKRQNEDKKN